ncbi:hypothetical protein RFI_04018, partial [Reticulomyxa filosa]
MSIFEVFVTIDAKEYQFKLISLTIDELKQQILNINKDNQQENILVTITDMDGRKIEENNHLQQAIQNSQFHFIAHFQSELKKNKCKEIMLSYQVKHALVLLAGAIKYEQCPYFKSIKQDLQLIQTLFQTKFGYQVFNTYDPQNPSTESLTLRDLDNFIFKHCANLRDDPKNIYDGLIFVDILFTSDNKRKDFKDVQNIFMKQMKYFVGKPKIFMKIVTSEQKNTNQKNENLQNKQWYNQDVDVLTVFANTTENEKGKASHFVETFCQIIEQNIDKNLQFIINQTTKMIFDQRIEKEIIQMFTSSYFDVYLIPVSISNNKIPDTLDFKKHWNRYWRQSNVEAAKMVEQMINKNEKGLIFVVCNKPEWKKNNDNFSSFITSISSESIDKKQFKDYWVYIIKEKLIILNKIDIDEDVNITSQLFITKNAIIDEKIKKVSILWNKHFNYDIPVQLQDLEDKKEESLQKKLFDDALIYLHKHLEITVNSFGFIHPYVVVSYNLIGNRYEEKIQYDKAINFYEKALQILLTIFGNNCPFVSQLYENSAVAYGNKGLHEKAIEFHEKSLNIRLNIFGTNNAD